MPGKMLGRHVTSETRPTRRSGQVESSRSSGKAGVGCGMWDGVGMCVRMEEEMIIKQQAQGRGGGG
ncbi:hypothetical protein BC567DRAFT_232109, partial [Phyllosticta citribraziliensis]